MRKFLKKTILEILKFFLILTFLYGLIYSVYHIGSYDQGKAYFYTINNMKNGSTKVIPQKNDTYADFLFYISDNPDKENEIRIFKSTLNPLADFFGGVKRYKNFFHAVSEEDISSLYFQLESSAEPEADIPNTVLLYYSHNKEMVDHCTYTYKDEKGNIHKKTENFNRYYPFMLIIPCIYNNGNWKNNILKVSFYDINGELIFEDIRT